MVKEDNQITAAFQAQLASRIGARRYELWFEAQTELSLCDGCLVVRTASQFVRDWVRKNFLADMHGCLESVTGRMVTIDFEIDPSVLKLPGAAADDDQPRSARGGPSQAVAATSTTAAGRRRSGATAASSCSGSTAPGLPASRGEAVVAAAPPRALQPAPQTAHARMSLDRFVVGPSNEYAFRAAELTAAGRQQASPLLFCGPTGVGKTHLLRAIQAEFRRRHPRARAVYLTAEQFTTSFVEAVRGSGVPSFRQKSRGCELLVLDDLQFFAGKPKTIEELLQTIDAMLSEGRQLILSSDRNLASLRPLGSELVSRLAGGLVCEVAPPEYATRLEILRGLCGEMGLALADEVLAVVATQITAGARELRGALHRLHAMSVAFDQPISRTVAEGAMADLARQGTRAVRLSDVQQAVCEVFGVDGAQLRSDRKGRTLAEPRMLAMWLARKYTRAPWSEIGQYFGRRSHSTVISAHRRVEKLISSQAHIDVSNQSCGVEEAIRRVEQVLRTA